MHLLLLMIFQETYKDETLNVFEIYYKRVQNKKYFYITSLRSNTEKKFKNYMFVSFSLQHDIIIF